MKSILKLLDAPTVNPDMQAIKQLHLAWVWDQYNLEHLKLSDWLKTAYPKREKGEVSKSEYQKNHERHVFLG